MIDALQNLDTFLFRIVNTALQNSVLDILMPFITDLNKQKIVLIVVGVVLILVMARGGRRGVYAVGALALGILFSDQLNSSLAKFILERPRPCHVLQGVHLLVGCGSGFSFPSSHAVNNLCGAVILSFFYPRAAVWLFSFAGIVCFSRVYVGVHYPSDVVGGAIVGIFCGLLVVALFLWLEHLVLSRRRQPLEPFH